MGRPARPTDRRATDAGSLLRRSGPFARSSAPTYQVRRFCSRGGPLDAGGGRGFGGFGVDAGRGFWLEALSPPFDFSLDGGSRLRGDFPDAAPSLAPVRLDVGTAGGPLNPPDPVVIIAGPTGSGKTDVATALARPLKAEVVSADSRQVYRDLSAGTAKPRGAWSTVDGVNRYVSEGVVHHLVDFLAPEERYDAGRFARDAGAAIEDARARGRRVVVAGGTGLYLRALARGIAKLPRGDETLRGELADLAAREGRPALHARLAAVDPEAAAAIPPNNLQRVIRALEIYRLTGRPITHWHRTAGGRSPWPFRWFGLKWPPADYDDHLKRRCARLWPGLLEETRRLLAGNLSPAAPAFESL